MTSSEPQSQAERIERLETLVRRLAEYAGVEGKMAHLFATLDPPAAPQYPRITGDNGWQYEVRNGQLFFRSSVAANFDVCWSVASDDVLAVASLLAPRKEFVQPDWLTEEWVQSAFSQRGSATTTRDVVFSALRRYHEEHLRGT